jgi:alpha-ketoglutarate-dependent 2,4-dichlorophenoxyacetate dioxygenase
MPLSVRPLTPSGFAAEVAGIDLTRALRADEVAAIDAGMDRYGVLVFHDQQFDDATQMAFSRYSDRMRLTALGNRLWHSDASFRAIPAKYSLLSARNVPGSGGNTEFADMRAAYDALDSETKAEIENLITEHSNACSREQIGFRKADYGEENQLKLRPVRHRLVRYDPRTGRKTLYLSAHIGAIVGWPLPEARMLIRDLIEHAVQRQFVYAHVWRQWDLVIWDNRTTMHRARRYNDLTEVRDMRRTTIRGDGVTTAQIQEAA